MVTEGQEEQEYKTTLKAETLEMARLELREDNNTREQMLEQFRQWIEKHPKIKKCRTDALFLLRFLRTKKFSLPLAQQLLERYLTIRQLHAQWFQKLDVEDPELELVDNGYMMPLPNRDQYGRKVLLASTERFDACKFTSTHVVRIHSMLSEYLMDDEENQVRGYTYIYDLSGMTVNHASTWSVTDIRDLLKVIQNGAPMRHKFTHIVCMPSSVAKIIEFAISLLNDKFKARVAIHKDIQSLTEMVDPKILPKEYGGEVPLSEMINEFKKDLKRQRDKIMALDDMHIELTPKDYSAYNNEEFGGVCGSFRKLEID